jgi:hypothetical protein
MTVNQFESNARKFVATALTEMHGKAPSKKVVDQATAELIRNFRPLLATTVAKKDRQHR